MQRQLVELAKRLPSAGWDVEVVLFYGGNPAFEAELHEAGVPLTILGKRHRWDVMRFALRLVATIRASRPDVVHSFLTVPNVVATALRPLWAGARVVWGVRDSNAQLRDYSRALRASFLLSRLLARTTDLIICNSHAGRRHYVDRGYPARRTVVVPNGIDTQRFRFDERARQAMRRRWGVQQHEQLVGVVARLDPMKGHRTFLEAAGWLLARRPELRFVCVGPGSVEQHRELAALAEQTGAAPAVLWTGDVADVIAAYSALDVLCLPSWSGEGFPNVIGEGMACGLPAVVSDVGDAALLVGDAGLVVPPRDPGALAAALELVLERQAQPGERSAGSRQRVVAEYDAGLLPARTVAAFSACLPGEARRSRRPEESRREPLQSD